MRPTLAAMILAAVLATSAPARAAETHTEPVERSGPVMRSKGFSLRTTTAIRIDEKGMLEVRSIVDARNLTSKPRWLWCRVIVLAFDEQRRDGKWQEPAAYGLGGSRSLPSSCRGHGMVRVDPGDSYRLERTQLFRAPAADPDRRTRIVVTVEDFDRSPRLLTVRVQRDAQNLLTVGKHERR